MKIEKFTDVCMTGGMHGRVTKVKVLFLVLVFVFNFSLF